ncbi:hypothetical protein GCM10023340_29760 [Nocardioides marinquilinus]|uniref:Integral membrane protein n=1 Tax=Nocardioides marinquilinus TaxID=1210400 RepID=A0ABP9PV34_9ACTN
MSGSDDVLDRPTSVTRAVQLVWLLVLLALAGTVLAVVFDDELLRASGAAGTTADDTRVPPSLAPVAVVLYVVVVSLLLVLLSFVLDGHNWARHCLAAAVGLLGVGTVAVLVTGPPLAVVVGGVVTLVVDALVVRQLYRPATAAYVGAGATRVSS